MRHQRDDGGWSLDVRDECQIQPGCPEDVHAESDTAATGLALLPFLGAGPHPHPAEPLPGAGPPGARLADLAPAEGRRAVPRRRMINSQMYSHAIATMALCEAYGLSKDPRLKEPAQRAINFIAQSQNKYDGGWRYSPGMAGDTSVFGWQMFALRSARLAGPERPQERPPGLRRTTSTRPAADKHRTTYGYLPGRPADARDDRRGACSAASTSAGPATTPPLVKGVAGRLGRPPGLRTSGTSITGTTRPSSCTTCRTRPGSSGTPGSATAWSPCRSASNGCDRGSWSPIFPQPDRWGDRGRPALPDLALDPDPGGLLPLPARSTGPTTCRPRRRRSSELRSSPGGRGRESAGPGRRSARRGFHRVARDGDLGIAELADQPGVAPTRLAGSRSPPPPTRSTSDPSGPTVGDMIPRGSRPPSETSAPRSRQGRGPIARVMILIRAMPSRAGMAAEAQGPVFARHSIASCWTTRPRSVRELDERGHGLAPRRPRNPSGPQGPAAS